MLARLQQLTTVGLLLFAAVWAYHFHTVGRPMLAALGACLIVFGYALVLGLEFVLLTWVHRDDPAPRATPAQLLRAWWGEVLTAPRVFCWRQPFRSRVEPDFVPAGAGRRGVVFVHGFVCNRGFWNPWLPRLRAAGVPFVAVNLEPVFGSIDDYARIVDAAVGRIEATTGLPPVIVAHSMGGIAARVWLAAPGHARRVARVVTIGTPHRGTWLARFGHTRNGRQMRIDNPWLLELVSREGALTGDAGPCVPPSLFTCFYGNCDNIVFPPSTATIAGADNRLVAGVAHVRMAFEPEIIETVLRWTAYGPSAGTGPLPAPPRSPRVDTPA